MSNPVEITLYAILLLAMLALCAVLFFSLGQLYEIRKVGKWTNEKR